MGPFEQNFKKQIFAHIYHDSKERGMGVGNEVVL